MTRVKRLLVCIALIGLGGRASACDNDSETSTHEQEFRSNYGGAPTSGDFASEHPTQLNLLIGSGLVLLVGSFVVVAKRGRTRA